MITTSHLLKYNFIFRYYLVVIFFLNLTILYKIFKSKLIKNIQLNKSHNINKKYCSIFKKISKIINNPIIFEYQMVQLKKINNNSEKYIKYSSELNKINLLNKNTKLYKYFVKIKKLLSKKYINNNDDEIIDILTKLIYVNF